MKINTALILCAGYGKRLNPITLDTPKPLLELHNVTILEKCIQLIKSLGIKKILINSFYLKDHFPKFFKDNNFDIDIEIIEDGKEILINENEQFHAASTMKTPVMIEAFKKSFENKISLDDTILVKNEFKSIVDGSLFKLSSFDDSDKKTYEKIGGYLSLRELIYDMITISSNFATNLVIDYIGHEDINMTMRDLGAKDINVLRGVEDIKAFNLGLSNTTTALDLLKIYENLVKLIEESKNK